MPGVLVTNEAGIKVPVGSEDEVIAGIAVAMKAFSDETVRKARGKSCQSAREINVSMVIQGGVLC